VLGHNPFHFLLVFGRQWVFGLQGAEIGLVERVLHLALHHPKLVLGCLLRLVNQVLCLIVRRHHFKGGALLLLLLPHNGRVGELLALGGKEFFDGSELSLESDFLVFRLLRPLPCCPNRAIRAACRLRSYSSFIALRILPLAFAALPFIVIFTFSAIFFIGFRTILAIGALQQGLVVEKGFFDFRGHLHSTGYVTRIGEASVRWTNQPHDEGPSDIIRTLDS